MSAKVSLSGQIKRSNGDDKSERENLTNQKLASYNVLMIRTTMRSRAAGLAS